jgi:hypothetical protein
MLRTVVVVCLISMSLIIGFSGCEKKSGQAVVLAKEHIAAALPVADTPNAESAASPNSNLVQWRTMKSQLMGT